jgi:beta-glucosidase
VQHARSRLALLLGVLSILPAACDDAPPPTAGATSDASTATAATTAGSSATPSAVSTPASDGTATGVAATTLDPSLPVEQRVDELLAQMTLAEKVGQMTMVDRAFITPDEVAEFSIGALLSGGGSLPEPNTVEAWTAMIDGYQRAALSTRLAIPIAYGIDAVHGNAAVYGATVFPHNIGLGAANDPELVRRIASATAIEMAAIGAHWDFAPVVAVPHDIRWGRTFEGFSADTAVVAALGAAFIDGLQRTDGDSPFSAPTDRLATAKHFVGDGAAEWGTSTSGDFIIDQGDSSLDEAELRRVHFPPYQAAIDAGVRTIMVSFSSWQGTKMHGNRYLLTDVLKGELGFDGIVLSDWAGIDQIPGDYASDIVTSINAGIDMVMLPADFRTFIPLLTTAVEDGAVPVERIDDAVRRILRVKLEMGLFERPFSDPSLAGALGTEAHRQLAREAVQRSAVLLKNDDHTLPLDTDDRLVLVAGVAADDIGLQSGGWTIDNLGGYGPITPGTTILEGLERQVGSAVDVRYDATGSFADLADAGERADVAIVVIAEPPYSEGAGDRADMTLPANDLELLERMRPLADRLVVVLLSGRPLLVTEQLPQWDAFVAAWLPGSEGDGVADVLTGRAPFTGHLPAVWPRWSSQLPVPIDAVGEGCDAPLFPFGFGLTEDDPSPPQLICLAR